MSDRITVSGLRARGYHGVFAQERRDGQDFLIDVTLECDASAAAATDELADTVDYGALTQRLHDIVAGPPVNLIETLAEKLAQACLSDARVSVATVTVHKPQAPVAVTVADIAVTVTRARTRPA